MLGWGRNGISLGPRNMELGTEPMQSSFQVSVSLFVILLVGGCTSENTKESSGPRISRREKQIATINALLDDAAEIRNRFVDDYLQPQSTKSRNELVSKCQKGVRDLDTARCPRDFRAAFRDYQRSLEEYLPLMKYDLAPWSADYRGSDFQDRGDPERSLHAMESEYARQKKRVKIVRAELKASFVKMRDVGSSYGVNAADVNPFQGPLADRD